MNKILKCVIILFIVHTTQGQTEKYITKSTSTVSVRGSSSLHDWEAIAKEFEGVLQAKIEDRKVVDITDFNFNFPVKSLKTGNSSMDSEMHDALKAKNHPTISYTYVNVEFIDDYNAIFTGLMTIGGVSKELKTPVAITTVANNVTISGTKTFLMTDFNLPPPKIILGLYKAKDEVTITYFINLKRKH